MHPLIMRAKAKAEADFIWEWNKLRWPILSSSCAARKSLVIRSFLEQKLEIERIKEDADRVRP